AVEKVLFGENEYEKIRKQKLIIQGLLPASLEKESMVERYFKNKAFEALSLKFHEKIWTLRCEAIAEWEELKGIDEGGKATRSRKRQKKNEKEKNEDIIKETKQKKFQRIFNDAKSILSKWISGFTRPAWLSAGRPFKEKDNFF
ncbi:10809_t:CDS:2, partial [Gigaspora rosea]